MSMMGKRHWLFLIVVSVIVAAVVSNVGARLGRFEPRRAADPSPTSQAGTLTNDAGTGFEIIVIDAGYGDLDDITYLD
jgi:hypothetical protein